MTHELKETSGIRKLAGHLVRYARPYRGAIAALLCSNLLLALLTAITPLLIAPIVEIVVGGARPAAESAASSESATGAFAGLDLAHAGRFVQRLLPFEAPLSKMGQVMLFGGLYVLAGSLRWIVYFAVYLLALWVRVRTGRDMQMDVFQRILSLPMSFFTRHKTGDLMSRLETDTMAITSTFEHIVTALIVSPILILFFGALLFNTSPVLAWAALAAGLFHYGVSKGIERPIRRHVKAQFSIFGDLYASLQESLLSIRVIKSFGAENHEVRKLSSTVKELVKVNMKYGIFKHVEEPVRGIVNLFIEMGILLLGASLLVKGELAPSAFLLFLYVGKSVVNPISSLGTAYTLIQQTIAASERVSELTEEEPTVADGTREPESFRKSLELENVTFSYGGDRVLHDVSVRIGKKEVVALVGMSGAGKSTITDLLLRFYDPEQGRITLDGTDIRDLKQRSYRRLFGVVSQECLLFNTTVRDNIMYGRVEESEDAMVSAARIANAHEFIMELPDGYDTIVGDRGIRLSGGQRQRIAIARAVFGRPEILILDEATSALDSESERLVQEAIERVVESTTAIVVAHRLSTIRKADRIVVLHEGRVEAVGNHADLMGKSATYQKLHRLQFEIPREDGEGADRGDL
ncbi:MAG: ABC transporter ATP-binding protein [Candidatus Hydrogenedentota bacterium]